MKAAVKEELIKEDDYQELKEAYTFLNHVRFRHQLRALEHHEKLSNNLNPDELFT